MERQFVSAEELVGLITQAMQQSIGGKPAFGGVYYRVPDASGCNWDVWTMSGQDSLVGSALQPVIAQLQARYNLLIADSVD